MTMERMIQRIRRQNLRRILEEMPGGNQELARLLEVNPSYISNLKIGQKHIGDEVAGKIERALSLPMNYLDRMSQTTGLDESLWADVEPFEYADKQTGSPPPRVLIPRALLHSLGVLGHSVSWVWAPCNEMAPRIQAEDCCLVDKTPGRQPLEREIWAFLWAGNLHIRRVFFEPSDDGIQLRADNPDQAEYPPILPQGEHRLKEWVGRVIWRAGKI